jgi:hypothetical protein
LTCDASSGTAADAGCVAGATDGCGLACLTGEAQPAVTSTHTPKYERQDAKDAKEERQENEQSVSS